jgi:hypothetical protein
VTVLRPALGPAARLVLAVVAAAGLVVVPVRAPAAAAAGPGLVLTTATTYPAVPSARVVRVAIVVSARNTKPNRVSGGILTRYFYDGARLAIQPEARNVTARDGSTRLTTKVQPATGYGVLDIRFRASLFYGQTAKITVTYDLPSGAPRSASDIRVGTAFVTFVAWAFGDGGSVRVDVPSSFDAEVTGSAATRMTSGATTSFAASNISDVGAWYLVVSADRASALTHDRIDLPGGEHMVIRAWPEDPDWSARVRELLTSGLPELVEETGLDWPVSGDIDVFEVHTPLLEGYSGQFHPAEHRIEISEDLDDLTILHEAAHAWFNNGLFVGRWINEGLADTYAADALHRIDEGEFAPNPVSPTGEHAVALDDWVHPGRITDPAVDAREQYGYEASWTVIRTLFLEVGTDGMRHVLHAAQHDQIAYVGTGTPETVSGPNDWRRLLDLLDELGRSKRADDLFRQFVLTPDEAATLDDRADARTAYAGLVAAGGDWRPPLYIRGPMSDWQFAVARSRIAEANALLARRDELTRLSASLGVAAPPALHDAYQTATDSLDGATAIATREIAAANALTVATSAVAAPRAPFVTIGLLGEAPETALAGAREAFTGDAPDAEARALAVTALIDGAVEVGRSRALTAALVVGIAAIGLIVLILLLRRRRRRRRLAIAEAAAAASPWPGGVPFGPSVEELAPIGAASAEPAPYATLADPAAAPEPEATTPPADHGDASLTQER